MRPYWRRDPKDIRGVRTYIKRRRAGLREMQGSHVGNRAAPIGAYRSFEMVHYRRAVALDEIFLWLSLVHGMAASVLSIAYPAVISATVATVARMFCSMR